MNPLDQHLPLPEGSRPAMGARPLLEQMHLHHSAHRGEWGLSPFVGIAAASLLRATAQGLSDAPDLDPGLLLRGWKDLPLILSPSFVKTWEREKPWKNWGINPLTAQAYQDILDKGKPSQAYLPEDAPGQYVVTQIWPAFFQNTNRSELAKTLHDSADIWTAWVRNHPRTPHATQSMDHLATCLVRMGLPHEHARSIALLEAWWLETEKRFPASGALLMAMAAHDKDRWVNMCAAVLGLTTDFTQQLFSPSSPAINQKLYAPLSENPKDPHSQYSIGTEKGLEWLLKLRHPQWLNALRSWSENGVLPWATTQNPHPELPTQETTQAANERWKHRAREFTDLTHALKGDKNPRVLVVGGHGNGKTQMVLDAIAAAGKNHAEVQASSTSPYSSIREKEPSQVDLLQRAAWEASLHKDVVLVLDNADKAFESEDVAKWMASTHSTSPLVVVVTELKQFHAMARERFDKVVWVDPMPLQARLTLAKHHFTSPELALRVARTLRTPKAIIDAARWCEKAECWDWPTIQSHYKSLERAVETTGLVPHKSDIDILPSVPKEELPPMVGNPHLQELADRLSIAFQNPEKFASMGTEPPKGAVLIGPPGTGKTLFARHLAAKLQVPIIKPDPAKLFENTNEVAKLFQIARENVPCLILLDEAEKVICPRFNAPIASALSSLLTELDGVSSMEGIMVVATTNASHVSEALTRPGRLSEIRYINVPFSQEREAIWHAYLDKRPLEDNAMPLEKWVATLSKASRGFTGAEIADVLRQSAGDAVAKGKDHLQLADLLRACDNVRWAAADGNDSIKPEERKSVAIHEAGHALLAWRWGLDVLRITIRSRSDSLGMVQWNNPERTHCSSRQRLFAKTQMMLGGIAAEKSRYQEYEGGGSSDLQITRRLVNFFFSQGGLGSLGPTAAPRDPSEWSEQLRQRIDLEIQTWSQYAFDEAQQWLEKNDVLLEKLSERLLELGDLSGPEMEEFEAAAQAAAELPDTPPRMSWVNPLAVLGSAPQPLPEIPQHQHNTLHRE